jgi:hypothetical protein
VVPTDGRYWQSDRLPPCGSFVGCLTDFFHALSDTHNFDCLSHSALDSTCATRGPDIHDSAHASHATSTASTSTVVASEGRTGGTSGQPSFDDHTSEAGLPATGRQTHIVGHLVVAALSGAHLRLCRPRRPILAPRHGGRI